MQNLNGVKKRIKSVQGIGQMTNAMQLVSAAKKRRSLALRNSMYPFFAHCAGSMRDIRRNADNVDNPFFKLDKKVEGSTWKIAYFVISGDQGLAGGYHNNIVKAVEEHVRKKILENSRKGISTEYKLYVLGKLARERLTHLGYNVDQTFSFPITEPNFYQARNLVSEIKQKFLTEGFDLVYIVYTHMETALNMKTEVLRLAPVDLKSIDEILTDYASDEATNANEKVEYYPDINEVFGFFIDTYLNAMVYNAMTDAYACEQTSRYTAMDNATKSAEDMMKALQLQCNRARQSKITNELTEIINGANQVNNL